VYRLFLSLRYLRSRRTNWIGMAGIFVAVAALILILSIMSGFLAESRGHLRGNLADLVIQPHVDYPRQDGRPLKRDVEGMLEIVRADEHVAAAAAQRVWYGMLAPEHRERGLSDPFAGRLALVSLVGIDVEDEYQVSDLRAAMLREPSKNLVNSAVAERVDDVDQPFAPPKRYVPDGRPWDSIVLGEQLANSWGLYKGDEVEITTVTLDPVTGETEQPKPSTFVVAGTFRSAHNEFDLERVYIDRRVLGDWLGGRDNFSAVTVKLKDYEADKHAARATLAEALARAGYLHAADHPRVRSEIATWEDFQRIMLAAIENEKTLLGIMLSLVLLVAGFTVFAILSMMVTEKRRDIGILCALGATPGGVLMLFLSIAFWEAVIGATLGTAAGIWAAHEINSIERGLSSLFGVQIFNHEVYLFDYIPTLIEAASVGLIVGGAFFATLVAAAIPAWRAARLDPVDALRHE
jgi:lipoprotein-releasing system permease protein